MNAVWTIIVYALRESVRRKMFLVVLLLTLAFLGLFWLATLHVFNHLSGINPPFGVDRKTVVGGTLLGLAMFATLFLGTVLAVFLTLGAIRGDAERGLLQPLVVRPIGRNTLLLSRFLGAAAVCIVYVLAVYGIALTIIDVTGPSPVEHRAYVPPRAVVVPGTRPRDFPAGTYHLACALIIGWRSESTNLKVSLNEALREHGLGA